MCTACGRNLTVRDELEEHNALVAHNGERVYNGWGSTPYAGDGMRVEYVVVSAPVKFHTRRHPGA